MKHALLFADGSCEGNGSPNARGAAAYVLLPGDSVTIREGFKVNQRPDVPVTVNVCEYAAVLAGLKHALKLGVSNIEVRTDSQLVVKQLNGEWKINYPWLKELNTEIRGIAKRFAKCEFVWIPREENVEADRIAYATLFDRPWKELESEPFPVLSNVATNVVSVIPTTEQVNRLADKIQGKRCEDGCKESPCSVELASPMLRALVKDRDAYEKMANSYAQDMLKAMFKVERLEQFLATLPCPNVSFHDEHSMHYCGTLIPPPGGVLGTLRGFMKPGPCDCLKCPDCGDEDTALAAWKRKQERNP